MGNKKQLKFRDNLDRTSYKPLRIDKRKDFLKQIKSLIQNSTRPAIVDTYQEQLEELFFLRNPLFRFGKNYKKGLNKFLKTGIKNQSSNFSGEWFFYPWLNSAVHFLPKKLYLELRTGRNKNLITKEEQEKFYSSLIGIAGLSVGSHVALTLAMTGGCKKIHLADPDIISGSNLNRIRTGLTSIGINKTIAVARQIYEINPYAEIQLFKQGLTDKNLKRFLGRGKTKLDLLIEETDHPYLKLKIRELARPLKIPVIMAADNGDGAIVDIERFDTNPKLPLLHGAVGSLTAENLKKLPPEKLPAVMAKIVGAEHASERMLKSVLEVGKSLYSWPQLGTAATLCGSLLTNLARKILLGQPIKTGRYNINPDLLFFKRGQRQNNKIKKLLKKLGV